VSSADRPPRRYQVSHSTIYGYSDVVTSSYGRGFLTPRETAAQRCLSHSLHIDPEPADSSTSTDAYGNLSSYFHVTERHRRLSVTSESVVEVEPPPPELYGAGSAAAPWEIARPVGPDGALATEFTLDLQRTR
jgi:transglutaminase-like putative cysteine protease